MHITAYHAAGSRVVPEDCTEKQPNTAVVYLNRYYLWHVHLALSIWATPLLP